MGKLSEKMNMLEKNVLKTLMDLLPSGTFSTMGAMGTDENKMMSTVTDVAVSTLAYCEEASEALDKIEDLEDKLACIMDDQEKIIKCLTLIMGQNKNEFKELGTRFDGLEEAVRELMDDKTLPKRATKKEKEE